MRNSPEEIEINVLYDKIVDLVDVARKYVATTTNLAMVYTNFELGKMIFEEEQNGNNRADYGKKVLKELLKKLTLKLGTGFSAENLDKMRFFYKTYSFSNSSTLSAKLRKQIFKTVHEKFGKPISSALPTKLQVYVNQIDTGKEEFILSWSHYMILMRIENDLERSFYEIESHNRNWSYRELQRNYNS